MERQVRLRVSSPAWLKRNESGVAFKTSKRLFKHINSGQHQKNEADCPLVCVLSIATSSFDAFEGELFN